MSFRYSRQNSFAIPFPVPMNGPVNGPTTGPVNVGASPDFGDLGLIPYTPSTPRRVVTPSTPPKRVTTPTTPHSPVLSEPRKSNGNYFSFPPNHKSGLVLLQNMTPGQMTPGPMTPGQTNTGVNLNDTIYDRRDSSNIV